MTSKWKNHVFFIAAAITLAADQSTKHYAIAISSLPTIRNPSSMLGGLLPLPRFVLVIGALLFLLWLLWWTRSVRQLECLTAKGMFVGGCAGNLLCQFFRDGSGVVDWLPMPAGHYGNLADISLMIGLLVLTISKVVQSEQAKNRFTPHY